MPAFPGRSCLCVAMVWVGSKHSLRAWIEVRNNTVEVGDVGDVGEVVGVVEAVEVVEVVEIVEVVEVAEVVEVVEVVEAVEAYRRQVWQEPCMGMRHTQHPAEEAKLSSRCALEVAGDMLPAQEEQHTCLLVVSEQWTCDALVVVACLLLFVLGRLF